MNAPISNTDFHAELTQQQVLEGEKRWCGAGDIAIARRVTIMVMSRSRDQLMEADPDTLLMMIDMAGGFINDLENTLKIARAAQARLFVVGDLKCNGELGIVAKRATPKKKKPLRQQRLKKA
jgi:hypothetical protein